MTETQDLTIEVHEGTRTKVTENIWRSWTGRRFIDGVEMHGLVFTFGTDDVIPASQVRVCKCDTCNFRPEG